MGNEDGESDEAEKDEGRLRGVVAGNEADRPRDADERRPCGPEHGDLPGVQRVSGQEPVVDGLDGKGQQPEQDRDASPERQRREAPPVCDQRPATDQDSGEHDRDQRLGSGQGSDCQGSACPGEMGLHRGDQEAGDRPAQECP